MQCGEWDEEGVNKSITGAGLELRRIFSHSLRAGADARNLRATALAAALAAAHAVQFDTIVQLILNMLTGPQLRSCQSTVTADCSLQSAICRNCQSADHSSVRRTNGHNSVRQFLNCSRTIPRKLLIRKVS